MATKLLLIEDVEDLGRSGEIVSVRPGFARNYLLPQGFAVVADKRALRMQAELQAKRAKKAEVDKIESESTANSLNGIIVTAVVKVDHEGHMYGSVSSHDIVELLQNQANVALEKRFVALKHAIKETGVHEIQVKLKEGVKSSFTLKIVPEEAAEAEAKQQQAASE